MDSAELHKAAGGADRMKWPNEFRVGNYVFRLRNSVDNDCTKVGDMLSSADSGTRGDYEIFDSASHVADLKIKFTHKESLQTMHGEFALRPSTSGFDQKFFESPDGVTFLDSLFKDVDWGHRLSCYFFFIPGSKYVLTRLPNDANS